MTSRKTANVQRLKRSICKVMGQHRDRNLKEPYLVDECEQYGGTAFFIDPTILGPNFPLDKKKRYLFTNYHVIDTLDSNECTLHYPEYGNSYINSRVEFIVPKFDVAIISVDPSQEHPMWLEGHIANFLEKTPNVTLYENIVKGNSQDVLAIGFPNLSSDYQICDGIISGRGLGMIQLNISFNGGNSGGPLFYNSKVIGICTASISESEALGLAVPMTQILAFFRKWANYSSLILDIPLWGFCCMTTTKEYLQYHDIEESYQGTIVNRVIPKSSVDGVVKEKDIIMGITSGDKRYNVDQYGLITVEWTDKKVFLDDDEFKTSLDPDDISLTFYQNKTKKIVTKPVHLRPVNFVVREIYPSWEKNHYVIAGGCVFMNFLMNHFHEDEDGNADCPTDRTIPISYNIAETMKQENMVVVTHIPFQTHVHNQKVLRPFDRIKKFNNKKVKDIKQFETLLKDAILDYNQNGKKDKKKKFIVLDIGKKKVYLNMELLQKDDLKNINKDGYPTEKLHLLQLKIKRNKRKR